MISFGGSDLTNECEKVLNAICSLQNKQFDVTAITGIHNQNFKTSEIKVKVYFQPCVPSATRISFVDQGNMRILI